MIDSIIILIAVILGYFLGSIRNKNIKEEIKKVGAIKNKAHPQNSVLVEYEPPKSEAEYAEKTALENMENE